VTVISCALLLLSFGTVVVAGVDNIEADSLDRAPFPVDGLQDLFMDTTFETQVGPIAKELDEIDNGETRVARCGRDIWTCKRTFLCWRVTPFVLRETFAEARAQSQVWARNWTIFGSGIWSSFRKATIYLTVRVGYSMLIVTVNVGVPEPANVRLSTDAACGVYPDAGSSW